MGDDFNFGNIAATIFPIKSLFVLLFTFVIQIAGPGWSP